MNKILISNITNQDLYNNQSSLILDGILHYDINKQELIKFTDTTDTTNNTEEEYEVIDKITDDNNDNNDNNNNDNNELEEYIKGVKEEIDRINKIMEFLVVNLDINKMTIPYYKVYDYSDLPKNLRTKVKSNSHIFDIKKFIMKNKINKEDIEAYSKKILNRSQLNFNLSENKIMIVFILMKIFNIYEYYHQNLNYSLKVLQENSELIKNKEKDGSYSNLININEIKNKEFMNLNDLKTSFSISYFDEIKNGYNKTGKIGTKIEINKNKDKDVYEIIFK